MNEEPLPTHPHLRAAIVDDTLTLIPWEFGLKTTGQLASERSDGQSAEFADLCLIGPMRAREVIVTHDQPHALTDEARATLVRWATLVGHRRILLPEQVVDLPQVLSPIGVATTECAVCGAEVSDGGFDFWLAVRNMGGFPNRCSACGGHLAQWTTASPVCEGGPS